MPQALPSDLLGVLSSTELFKAAPAHVLQDLAAEMELISVDEGQIVIRQGERDDSVYVVASGRLRVSVPGPHEEEKVLAELGPGQSFGEIALLTGYPRSANVYAITRSRLLKLSRAAFDRVEGKHPQAMAEAVQIIIRSIRKAQLSFAVHLSNLFGPLAEELVRDLEGELELVTLPGGEILFRQGEVGDGLYIVLSGRLRVVVEREGQGDHVVAELGRGETVGEMAVLSGEPRSATVYGVRDTHLAKLSQAGLESLLSKHPRATTLLFARKIALRLKEQISGRSRADRVIATIAVAPAGSGVPLAEFCERFASALSLVGRTLHLGSERLDRDLGRKGAAQASETDAANIRLVEWLDSQEREYRFVVYESDEVDSPWTRRCLRQADHILIVGNASANPAPGPLEKQILETNKGKTGSRMSLVLLYGDASQQPRDTSKWLAERRVERHHHIRLSSKSDFERLARFLTGRAVGLVLGGGSARGLAHPGVIRALEEAGIPIDALGGTSMGALIGGEYLEGYDYERMVRVAGEGTLYGLHDLTFPALAFLAGRKRGELVYSVWGDKQIEDFWLPFFCVSANLTRAAMQVHTRGSVVKSMAATCSIPAMLPPVVWDSDLLVDGGLMNNVPVDVMRSFPDVGTVIAVDVSPALDQLASEDYGFGYSGWRALWTKINPFSKEKSLLNIFAVLMRTIDFGGASHKSQVVQMADLYIRPPLEQFLVNDFKRGMEMAEVAYQYSKKEIEAWKAGVAEADAGS